MTANADDAPSELHAPSWQRRWRSMVLVGISTLIVLVGSVVAIRHAHAPAKSTAAFRWATIASPYPGTGDNQLSSTAVVDAHDAWAIGFDHPQNDSLFYHTLTEHWDGSAWKIVPSPNPGSGNNLLSSIAALAATDAWAVGEYQPGLSGPNHTLIEHWDGTMWSVIPSPNPAGKANLFFSVTAITAVDAWAAGLSQDPTTGILQTLIEQWNGTMWSIVPSVNPGSGNNALYGISAASEHDVWAVGDDQDGLDGIAHTLIEHWDGSAWVAISSPNRGAGSNVLASIDAIAAHDIWAAGYAQNGPSGASQTLIERWNGAAWTVEPTPNPGPRDNEFFSIAALNDHAIWAAGNFQDPSGNLHTLTERWNGTAWTIESTPNPGYTNNSLVGIAAVDANHAWAVGEYHDDTPFQLLILQGSI